MKKLFIIFFFLFSTLFASEVKILKSIDELSENKDIFLMFSTTYCPWCIKQARVLEKISEKRKNFQIFKVQDDTSIYKELLKEYPFVIEVFPTSYIVSKKDGKLDLRYEFQGYQKEKNILAILDDKENF